jgi:hypothetical protein
MSGVKRRYQGVPVMQLAIEDYPANNLPKVQVVVNFCIGFGKSRLFKFVRHFTLLYFRTGKHYPIVRFS